MVRLVARNSILRPHEEAFHDIVDYPTQAPLVDVLPGSATFMIVTTTSSTEMRVTSWGQVERLNMWTVDLDGREVMRAWWWKGNLSVLTRDPDYKICFLVPQGGNLVPEYEFSAQSLEHYDILPSLHFVNDTVMILDGSNAVFDVEAKQRLPILPSLELLEADPCLWEDK